MSCPEYPELKIRIKELAYEAQANRKEAQQHTGLQRHSLNLHRKVDIRKAARNTQLAYGYCRGRDRIQMEWKPRSHPSYTEISRMIRKYGGPGREGVSPDDVWQWFQGKAQPILRQETAAAA